MQALFMKQTKQEKSLSSENGYNEILSRGFFWLTEVTWLNAP